MDLSGGHQYQMASLDEDSWMLNDNSNMSHGDSFSYVTHGDSSTDMEHKRKWFPEASDQSELFPRKKQAIEAPISSNLESAGLSDDLSWENGYMNWLFGSERNAHLLTTNDSQFENASSSVGLSYDNRERNTTFVTTGDPQFENFSSSIGLSYDNRERNTVFVTTNDPQFKNVRSSIGLSYDNRERNTTLGTTSDPQFKNGSSSIGLSYDNRERNTTVVTTNDPQFENVGLSIGLSYDSRERNTTLVTTNDPQFENISSSVGLSHDNRERDTTFVTTSDSQFKNVCSHVGLSDDNFERNTALVTINDLQFKTMSSSVGLSYDNLERNTALVTINDPQFENVNSSIGLSNDNCKNRLHKSVKRDFGKSKGISDNKRDSNGITFSKYQEIMEALAKPVSSYSLLYEQPLEKTAVAAKNKLEKRLKVAPNSFPTNVKSLTSTGMLDGVPVKYISGSRELPAIIQGPGYLCGCQSCNYTKVQTFNAYELEQHAGCKTSHPNNHIRFENGKSIHQVVQELKATPQNMLSDAILTVTGSPINQNAFLRWRESYQAATRKL